jgi:anti-anti-sigma factor
VLQVSGDLDAFNMAQFDTALLDAVGAQPAAVVLDLTALNFIDSVGLSALYEASRLQEPTEIRIVATGLALRPIQLGGLDTLLRLFPTVVAASAL